MKALTPLPLIPSSYLDRYVAIRDKKHKETREPLVAAHALLTQRYQDHAEAIALGTLSSLTKNLQAIELSVPLRACYGGATKPLKMLKKDIKGAQPQRQLKYCPMCGTTLPKTYDHYLPAVEFPEFAVHPLNLVPCCALCNSIKDDDWLSAAGERQYLHAYVDALPDVQFVHVTLHEHPAMRGVEATFSLNIPASVPAAQRRLIEVHFRRLQLIARYDELGNDEIAEILSDCKTHQEAGGSQVRIFLCGRAADRTIVHGRNHWTAVLMSALAEHTKLQSWIDAA
ncbi:hypothetical protein GUH49_02735 [Xanthomonas citri pv. citri]|nr:hypothetical protein [Xanthomonas citri]MBD1474449.1 hypothetical protein [Xanthomonas citri pv. citri]